MVLEMLMGKIHRATVTEAKLDYVGSVTIDPALLELSGILEYQKVTVVDINNGSRLETYVIAGERESGTVCLNGAAARSVAVGDKVIIMAYASFTEEELKSFSPKVVFVDDENKPVRVTSYERHGRMEG